MPRTKRPWWHKYMWSRARQVWGWSPARRSALKRQARPGDVWECEQCKRRVPADQRDVDHTLPAVPTTGWDSWDSVLHRLLDTPAEELRVLCTECHGGKTSGENKRRVRKKTAEGILAPKTPKSGE